MTTGLLSEKLSCLLLHTLMSSEVTLKTRALSFEMLIIALNAMAITQCEPDAMPVATSSMHGQAASGAQCCLHSRVDTMQASSCQAS